MLVSYLPLLFSALVFSQQITFTARNIYRLALPLFVGIFLMALPPVYLQDLPLTLRPLLSNGLLVGIYWLFLWIILFRGNASNNLLKKD